MALYLNPEHQDKVFLGLKNLSTPIELSEGNSNDENADLETLLMRRQLERYPREVYPNVMFCFGIVYGMFLVLMLLFFMKCTKTVK